MKWRSELVRLAAMFAAGLLCGWTALLAARTHAHRASTLAKQSRVAAVPEPSTNEGEPAATEGDLQRDRLKDSQESLAHALSQPSVLIRRWAGQAPEEAFRAFSADSMSRHLRPFLSMVIDEWVGKDPASALAAAETVSDERLRQELVVSVLLKTDPAAAFDRLLSFPGRPREDLYDRVLAQWAEDDPAAASRRSVLLEDPAIRKRAVGLVSAAMARSDPERALQWAAALENRVDRIAALRRVLGVVAEIDPAVAAQALSEIDPGPHRESTALEVISAWAKRDPHAALDWAREQTQGETLHRGLSTLARALVSTDPDKATSMLAEIPFGHERSSAVRTFAGSWAASDPRSAFAWAQKLESGDRETAFSEVARRWLSENPWEALRFAVDLPDDPGFQDFRESTASQWAEVDPKSAAAWAASLSGEAGLEIHRVTVNKWAWTDPGDAAGYVETLDDPQIRQDFGRDVARVWAGLEPAGAAEWAVENLDASKHSETFGEVTERWSEWDPLAASKWVGTLQEGPGRDAAVQALIQRIKFADPAGAAAWAETFSDPALRERWKAEMER